MNPDSMDAIFDKTILAVLCVLFLNKIMTP